jgi:hypothetical protein
VNVRAKEINNCPFPMGNSYIRRFSPHLAICGGGKGRITGFRRRRAAAVPVIPDEA